MFFPVHCTLDNVSHCTWYNCMAYIVRRTLYVVHTHSKAVVTAIITVVVTAVVVVDVRLNAVKIRG